MEKIRSQLLNPRRSLTCTRTRIMALVPIRELGVIFSKMVLFPVKPLLEVGEGLLIFGAHVGGKVVYRKTGMPQNQE